MGDMNTSQKSTNPLWGSLSPCLLGNLRQPPQNVEQGLPPTAASPTAGYSQPCGMLTKVVACRRRGAEPPKPWSFSSSLVPSSCFSRAHLLAASSSCEGPILSCSGGYPLSLPRSGGAGDAHLPLHCSPTGLARRDSFSVPPKVFCGGRGVLGGNGGDGGLASSSRSRRFSASSRACSSPAGASPAGWKFGVTGDVLSSILPAKTLVPVG